MYFLLIFGFDELQVHAVTVSFVFYMQLGGSKRLGAQKLNRSFSDIEKQADQQQSEHEVATLVQHSNETDKDRIQSRLAVTTVCT